MLQIHIIPAFNDNYFWLIQPDIHNSDAYILDPGTAEPVRARLKQSNLTLKGILITHHHHDHIDGAAELSKEFSIPIYGPKSARIPQVTHHLKDGDILNLGAIEFSVLGLAGHTLDHIGYYSKPHLSAPLLFCGDTLFAGGCGRLFDGTAEMLYQSLQKISLLDDDTIIYCAHEYTLANLEFARFIEPDNTDLITRQNREIEKRQQDRPTIPTQLLLEKRTNPFLRCHIPQVHNRVEEIAKMKMTSIMDVFTYLRRAKDQY